MSELAKSIRQSVYQSKLQQDVTRIFNMLRDYIPRSCENDAMDDLYKAFEQSGLELTDRNQREQYEAVMELCADGAKYDAILAVGKIKS